MSTLHFEDARLLKLEHLLSVSVVQSKTYLPFCRCELLQLQVGTN
jgi:hypothetical protein